LGRKGTEGDLTASTRGFKGGDYAEGISATSVVPGKKD